jgi:hypothetical protein
MGFHGGCPSFIQERRPGSTVSALSSLGPVSLELIQHEKCISSMAQRWESDPDERFRVKIFDRVGLSALPGLRENLPRAKRSRFPFSSFPLRVASLALEGIMEVVAQVGIQVLSLLRLAWDRLACTHATRDVSRGSPSHAGVSPHFRHLTRSR